MELEVFVGPGCEVCDRTFSIVSEIGKRFSNLTIKIVDLGETESSIPEEFLPSLPTC